MGIGTLGRDCARRSASRVPACRILASNGYAARQEPPRRAVGYRARPVAMLGLTALNNPYFGRRVLITGHTGFKGSWLALWLTELGAEVTGVSLAPPTSPNHWDLL